MLRKAITIGRRATLLMCCVTVASSATYASDPIPGAPQSRPVALVGGTIHPVSGPTIRDASLIFEDGRIAAIGPDLEVPDGAEVIRLKGRHVYPGLIEAHSRIGLTEISAVRATRDERETGRINPNVKANVSVNPDSEIMPVTRSNGVLLALTAPAGGLISGRAAVLQLDGWTYEDMTLKADAALIVNWPRMSPALRRPDDEPAEQQISERNQSLQRLRELFDDARAYAKARAANPSEQEFDIRLDSLIPVIEKQIPLLVAANGIQEIQSSVAFAREQNLRMILFGGYDAVECASLLKQNNVPVIISAVHRSPRYRQDDYDASYTLPERLRAAGIEFCVSGSNRSSASNVRNLPYHAATAAAYGLSRAEALKSVTLYPARILGVDDRVGSLEIGKDATLIVTSGNPLETTTQIEAAWIQGRRVDLDDRHKQLYRKYREKYRRQRE